MDKKPIQKWSTQDAFKLLKLAEEQGKYWIVFSVDNFPGRTAEIISKYHKRIKQVHDCFESEVRNTIHELLGKEKNFGKIDWEHVQQSLSQFQPLSVIQFYYCYWIQPEINEGKWAGKETRHLLALIKEHETNWELISEKLGTHSSQQCKFRKEEDEALLDAVKKYGKNSKIKHEMNSKRSATQLRCKYFSQLKPEIDKSPWTHEEEEQLFGLYRELKSVNLAQKKMNKKRSMVALRYRLKKQKMLQMNSNFNNAGESTR